METYYDPELDLLGDDTPEDESTGSMHAFRTAPVFTGDAFASLGSSILPQRALYGRVIAQRATNFPLRLTTPKLYMNTNAPFSALGSGKSHSTSVLLESCLMADSRLGTLPAPLSALVFHFDTAAGGGAVQPCEAAYLATLDNERGGDVTPPTVTVLVLPANIQAMRRVYAGLPSVHVKPLHFSAADISGERLLAMMKVEENTQMPLYMEAIMSILRSMESNFNYTAFRDELKQQKFSSGQKAMLNLRLSLLDSCLEGGNAYNRVSSHFRKGHLTIIDLSSPFMDGSSACGFFDLILGLFVEADVDAAGKLVVLDEAHKYLSDSQTGTSSRLTDSLLSVIRQQRHLATRVVISTQEPTVVPSKFLDLCSFIIAHRFSSPKWLRLLANHVSAAEDAFDELFAKIVSLRTGQAIMFAPNGLGVRDGGAAAHSDGDSGASDDAATVAPIGQGYFHVQSRLRVTRDGGHSILAVSDPESTTRLGRVPGGGKGKERAEPVSFPDWGSANASASVPTDGDRAGEAPAPAETPAEAAAPPGLHRSMEATTLASDSSPSDALADPVTLTPESPAVQPPDVPQQSEQTEAPMPTVSTPAPSVSDTTASPSTSPPVFKLVGDLARFTPLIDYVRQRLSNPQFVLTVKNIRRGFSDTQPLVYGNDIDQVVDEAVQRGLLLRQAHNAQPAVALVPGAIYISVAPASLPAAPEASTFATATPPAQYGATKYALTGHSARFAPLIRYMTQQRDSGFTEITVATIRRRFGESVEEIISDAKQLGMIKDAVNSSKPKVMLVPRVTFTF
ncbi:uncharacterized protein PHACADRAFT_209653 [Phanerochaete carnosa HHB-10118-sp]|uniref:Helicase HerA central domain-containing protein n=1 Tax=Phanerochaete carnosa (strain HHB-10118-sp) TaxID=650164 RepID=K5WB03_PHACS|nr:uncharacterized protein PHACADRAFT_209653 [Phanerochaete carnosa HHB-10118-sp]EKM56169.1 hypothetical protein PHACADRAFT_209653 [Phanerochaete carnosa HHB-10118-sp]